MARKSSQQKDQAAWNRIEALGGRGVWEREMCVVSFAKSGIKDENLAVFSDFPHVQILDLSHTSVGDRGLAHLTGLKALETLIVVDTKISGSALKAFQKEHPSVTVTSKPAPKGTVNRFTGKKT
jgi:hypothetical protein